jgi:uncharacterized protein (TIGR00299 family) protein
MPLLAYLDAFSGISGDMLVGALADAGADTKAIGDAIRSLEIGATVSFEKVRRCGIGATRYHVEAGEQRAHRHLAHIVKIIEKAGLPERAARNAVAIFQRLGEAEAAVHHVPIEKVHFHEVGAADSIADIVGASVGFELLGVDRIVCSPVNVGSGTVNTEHGVLPVPAPATARLLTGVPVYSRGPAVELATPTGAAVVVTLAERFGTLPPMSLTRTGYGAGSHDFPGQANVLRVMLGEPAAAEEALEVTVIEAHIDDLNPQVLAYAAERLAEAVARHEDRETLAQMVFAETSTLGLRMYAAERRVQARRFEEVETKYGKVRMKIASEGSYAPEYEDCRRLALETGAALKEVIAEANYTYQKQSK